MRQSGAGRPPAISARDGLGGAERWEPGNDPPYRGGLSSTGNRPTVGRPHAGHRRLFDLSHLDHEMLPENTMADAERWAAGIQGPAYAMTTRPPSSDDGAVDVISDGHWKLFTP